MIKSKKINKITLYKIKIKYQQLKIDNCFRLVFLTNIFTTNQLNSST